MGKKSKSRKPKAGHNPVEETPMPNNQFAEGFGTYAVFNPEDEFGFVYSVGNDAHPHNEFVAFRVPRAKAESVGATMSYLRDRTVEHGHDVRVQSLHFLVKLVEGAEKQNLMETHTTKTDPSHPLFELVPRFKYSEPELWGGIEPAPEGEEELVQCILRAWVGHVVLFIDGDKSNCSAQNLKWVELAVALRHVEDWVAGWNENLSTEQAAFVRKHLIYFYRLAKGFFRKAPTCAQCGLIGNLDNVELFKCAQCKRAYYCCLEHQKAHWPQHKLECKKMKSCRNNKKSHK